MILQIWGVGADQFLFTIFLTDYIITRLRLSDEIRESTVMRVSGGDLPQMPSFSLGWRVQMLELEALFIRTYRPLLHAK